jgi:hypothetical protein
MKKTKDTISFKEVMDASIEESIEESYANYGGTNTLGSVQSSSRNKYSPATVLKAPPVRHLNPDITMGQSDLETQAPAPMLYPFESIFSELVELYTRIEAVQQTMDGAKTMATLSDAKQQMVKDSAEELIRLNKRLRKIIADIEEVTL